VFPDVVSMQDMVESAWSTACKDKGVVIKFEEDFLQLVCYTCSLRTIFIFSVLDHSMSISSARGAEEKASSSCQGTL
jgi:hypothetical protein